MSPLIETGMLDVSTNRIIRSLRVALEVAWNLLLYLPWSYHRLRLAYRRPYSKPSDRLPAIVVYSLRSSYAMNLTKIPPKHETKHYLDIYETVPYKDGFALFISFLWILLLIMLCSCMLMFSGFHKANAFVGDIVSSSLASIDGECPFAIYLILLFEVIDSFFSFIFLEVGSSMNEGSNGTLTTSYSSTCLEVGV